MRVSLIGIGSSQASSKPFSKRRENRLAKHLSEFCRAIAFYNFIQEMMPAAGDRPTGTQWTCAAVPFFECLEKVNPSHVVACGFELWANLPSERFSWLSGETEAHLLGRLPTQYQDSAQHRKHGWVGRYDHAGGGCLILKIHHPSIAFQRG